MNLYLICYDIADPRRLAKVHRFLAGEALPVQYSVFAGQFTPARLREVVGNLLGMIAADEDDVRIYPLPERCEAVFLGRRPPEGTGFLAHDGAEFLSKLEAIGDDGRKLVEWGNW